jgi:hypothetical protein
MQQVEALLKKVYLQLDAYAVDKDHVGKNIGLKIVKYELNTDYKSCIPKVWDQVVPSWLSTKEKLTSTEGALVKAVGGPTPYQEKKEGEDGEGGDEGTGVENVVEKDQDEEGEGSGEVEGNGEAEQEGAESETIMIVEEEKTPEPAPEKVDQENVSRNKSKSKTMCF